MFRFRAIGPIVRAAGLGRVTGIFAAIFVVCALIICFTEPSMENVGDALWFCFQAVTTIGFGDLEACTLVGRIVTVLLSIISIFYLAVITGVVVSYVTEIMRKQRGESVAHFMDKMEHLTELSHEELEELSAQAKRFHRMNK